MRPKAYFFALRALRRLSGEPSLLKLSARSNLRSDQKRHSLLRSRSSEPLAVAIAPLISVAFAMAKGKSCNVRTRVSLARFVWTFDRTGLRPQGPGGRAASRPPAPAEGNLYGQGHPKERDRRCFERKNHDTEGSWECRVSEQQRYLPDSRC